MALSLKYIGEPSSFYWFYCCCISKRTKCCKPVKIICFADPTYMIRAIPSNASDNVFCTLLAQSAVHGAMAGYTGFTVGPVNGRNCYIPFHVSSIDPCILFAIMPILFGS